MVVGVVYLFKVLSNYHLDIPTELYNTYTKTKKFYVACIKV